MYLASKLSSRDLLLWLLGATCGLLLAWIATPLYRTFLSYYWQEEFSELTFRCDQSMRQHLIAKSAVAKQASDSSVDRLKSAELALLDCQDYDLLQKKLKLWGLTDNEISRMVLLAVEAEATSIRKVVRIHEIPD